MSQFSQFGNLTLETVAQLLRSSQILPNSRQMEAAFGIAAYQELTSELARLQASGWTTEQIAELVLALLQDRKERERIWSWVVSGPSQDGVPTRDTGVVFRSLVQEAQREIFLTSYALYRGKELLEPVFERIKAVPGLQVRMVLDVSRDYGVTTLSDVLVERFAQKFISKHWPWKPVPEVWYDPRGLELDSARKAVLHAKCVIIDRRVALVSSANLTHAAQQKNIEAGVLVRDPDQVGFLQDFFEGLISSGSLRRLDLG